MNDTTRPDGRSSIERPDRAEAEAAVRTLIRWAGDDPDREGLAGTPARVARAYEEFFSGYDIDPVEVLSRTFEETEGYDEMVVLRDIRFESHCEHHMAPIIGRAHIAYLPRRRVVGISKLARLLEIYSRRPQTRRQHGDEPDAGRLPFRCVDPPRIPLDHRKPARRPADQRLSPAILQAPGDGHTKRCRIFALSFTFSGCC